MVYVKIQLALGLKKGNDQPLEKSHLLSTLGLCASTPAGGGENRIAGMEASTVILCSSFPRTLIKVIE